MPLNKKTLLISMESFNHQHMAHLLLNYWSMLEDAIPVSIAEGREHEGIDCR